MSCNAYLRLNKVISLNDKSRKPHYEPKLYDDNYTCDLYWLEYSQAKKFSNPKNDLEFLYYVIRENESSEDLTGLLQNLFENERGITVGERYYEWDEIKHAVADHLGEILDKGKYELSGIGRKR